MKRRVVLILALLCTMGLRAAINLDSLLNLPVLAVPQIGYSPETNWEFGAAAQGYFKLRGQDRTSMVQLDGTYSLNRQWYVKTLGNLYFPKWQLQYRVGYRDYPDLYFNLGNAFLAKPGTSYASKRFDANVQPQYNLPMNWSVGGNLDVLYEVTSLASAVAVLGVGAVAQYDTRDVLYYPNQGLFFKTTATYYESLNPNYGRFGIINTDLRHYVTLRYPGLVFAWQLNTQWAVGRNIPFQMLPTLGGADLMRGVRKNMFRDNAMLALQAELRLPIWKIFHACVFAGVGDVYDTSHWRWAVPKVGYGIGGRIQINKSGINLRADVARNNIYKEWNTLRSYSFYLTVTEAF